MIVINRCSCGWQFMALSKHVTRCPQCRDVIMTCACCGKDISDRQIHAKYCPECAILTKKALDRIHLQISKQKKMFKYIQPQICDYDCANCKYGDCILPVDKEEISDDIQEEFTW